MNPFAGAAARTSSSSAQWTGRTANYTLSGDDIAPTAGDSHIKTVHTFAGDFDLKFTMTALGNSTGFGFYLSANDAEFSESDATSADAAGVSANAGSFYINNDGASVRCEVADALEGTITPSNGDVIVLRRVGTAVTIEINSTTAFTFSSTSTGTVRIFITSFGTTLDFDDVSWSGGA